MNVDGLLLVLVAFRRFDCGKFEVSTQYILPESNKCYLWPANCLMVHFKALFSGT